MMWWVRDDVAWWGWLVMGFGMLAFWAVVAWVVVTLVRGRTPSSDVPASSARQILAERFARGEIDEDEYRSRLTTLTDQEGRSGPPVPH